MGCFKNSLIFGLIAGGVGFIATLMHWNLWDVWGGPMPGYELLVFPGRLTLLYLWQPLFTEEIDLVAKVALMLLGQFAIVSGICLSICKVRHIFDQ
ncbi:hypothetical protein QWI17_09610 [Gilvimarinus sp. SDUM040013]|uniref:Uncharacterized protein n=1 Tax=Gilvimarinus gilvus TaxID=3058038 RepID=A0ABU4S3E9_9GAMM|nr:hypothetical protein [Gilvimarinus sp. SDUM040013]MDO3386091.1 hypothetical protein [Gilvimarinus sp. SDUM040013]MDX6850368.1 hypothetical protein [Gilvimarinus sp. SDUM040013]